MTRIAIFASGAGSNARKIIEHFSHHQKVWVELVVCNKPPITIIPLIALVTAIKGVCNECDTFVINCQPTNTANTNTVKC